MRQYGIIRGAFLLGTGLALSACGSGTTIAPSPPVSSAAQAGGVPAMAGSSNLYVADPGVNQITVYASQSGRLLRTISKGLVAPKAMAFDRRGNLYVANGPAGRDAHGRISVYPPHATAPSTTIEKGLFGPVALLFDSSGTLHAANPAASCIGYFACGGGSLTAFAPSETKPLQTIQEGWPLALALDSANNLYVADFQAQAIFVYAPGSAQPTRTITSGIHKPRGLLLDAAGHLVVQNNTSVAIQISGKLVQITRPRQVPSAIALDQDGNFYVAWNVALPHHGPGDVTVYGSGSKKPERTITRGATEPISLLVDPAGTLYVGNRQSAGSANGSIAMYHYGKSKPFHTITDAVHDPSALAIGP